jgi:hypothetical protein
VSRILAAAAIVGAFLVPHVGSAAGLTPAQRSARSAIIRVWGANAALGLRISWCESRWLTWEENGQYRGLFQMGSRERQIYGDSATAAGQAAAALRYFRRSGTAPWASSSGCWS